MKRQRVSAANVLGNAVRAVKMARTAYKVGASAGKIVGGIIQRVNRAQSASRRPVRRATRSRSRRSERKTRKSYMAGTKTANIVCCSDKATHIHRYRTAGKVSAAQKAADIGSFSQGGTLATVEASMANLRYYDPVTNGLITANDAAGSYYREVNISIYRRLLCRNNYKVPVEVRVYSCVPKQDVFDPPGNFYLSGLVDQGNPLATSPLMYPTDSKDLTNLWSLKCTKRVLQPGQEMAVVTKYGPFKYNVSTNDQHTQTYQRKQGGHCYLVRVCGALGHDTTNFGAQGILPCAVDVLLDVVYTIKYDAGKDLHDFSLNDVSAESMPAPVLNNKPAATAQAYSAQ